MVTDLLNWANSWMWLFDSFHPKTFVGGKRVWERKFDFKNDFVGVKNVECVGESVWPDARVKSGPIFPQVCPKSSNYSFYIKSGILKDSPKISKYLGYFWQKNAPRTLKISPIWSHYWRWQTTRCVYNLPKHVSLNTFQNCLTDPVSNSSPSTK